MILLMAVPGLIAVIFGLVFMWGPKNLTRRAQAKNPRVAIDTDTLFIQHRLSVGICFISIGAFCLLSALYVWVRLNL